MKRANIGVFVLLFVLSGAAFAVEPGNEPEKAPETAAREFTWIGKLVDQACKEKSIDGHCPVSPETERFGLVVDGGTILPFDEAGNQAARDALAKGNHRGYVEVTVVGARDQGLFQVESIQVGK